MTLPQYALSNANVTICEISQVCSLIALVESFMAFNVNMLQHLLILLFKY